jgi:hypothetical protein
VSAAQPGVAADLLLAYARKQAAERQGRWADMSWSRAVLFLTLLVMGGCFSSKDEVARLAAPSGDVEGVVVETNGGATTSFGYEVHVVERGAGPGRLSQVAFLYGAGRNDEAYGVNLRWESNDVLLVEYLDARSTEVGAPSTRVANRPVIVLLKAGTKDPNAPPGGMLYNLRNSGRR